MTKGEYFSDEGGLASPRGGGGGELLPEARGSAVAARAPSALARTLNSRELATPEEVVARLEAWYEATLSALFAERLGAPGATPRGWDEEGWILQLGRRAELAERGRGELAMQLIAEQLRTIDLERQIAAFGAERQGWEERWHEQARQLADLRQCEAIARAARDDAELRVRAFLRDGENALTELRTLVEAYRRRVEALERESASAERRAYVGE